MGDRMVTPSGAKPDVQARPALRLAEPHGFCAGVRRAVAMADCALANLKPGEKVYCLHELVHNRLVVERLAARGMVFTDSLDAIPDGATVFFSAHGVSPAIRAEAARRGFHVIDATCAFVTRLHKSVRDYADRGYSVLFIGTRGHDETEGVRGEAPDRVRVVENAAEAASVALAPGTPAAVLAQTTLAAHQVAPVVDALRRRLPGIVVPEKSGICLATTERQDAVRRLAAETGFVIVLGSPTSANSKRLAEVARDAGARAFLLQDLAEVRDFAASGGFSGCAAIGVTAGASTPEDVVDDVVSFISKEVGLA